ncbi:hypothetical protein [Nitrospira moscoviensis]|uniref:hypothetical protein n=1 Tax=Nitrospira moscoviensis TaxID=42253 RepID=UPI001EE6C013|nr:hypothetical protein [Nitrospira moscoviensis]
MKETLFLPPLKKTDTLNEARGNNHLPSLAGIEVLFTGDYKRYAGPCGKSRKDGLETR